MSLCISSNSPFVPHSVEVPPQPAIEEAFENQPFEAVQTLPKLSVANHIPFCEFIDRGQNPVLDGLETFLNQTFDKVTLEKVTNELKQHVELLDKVKFIEEVNAEWEKFSLLSSLLETKQGLGAEIEPLLKIALLCFVDVAQFSKGKWDCAVKLDGKIYHLSFPGFKEKDVDVLACESSFFKERLDDKQREDLAHKVVKIFPSKSKNLPFFLKQVQFLQPLTSSLAIHGRITLESLRALLSRFSGELNTIDPSFWALLKSISIPKEKQYDAWKEVFLRFFHNASLLQEGKVFLDHVFQELELLKEGKKLTEEESQIFDDYRLFKGPLNITDEDSPLLAFLGKERKEIKKSVPVFQICKQVTGFKENLGYLLHNDLLEEALNFLYLHSSLEGFSKVQEPAQKAFHKPAEHRNAYLRFSKNMRAKTSEDEKLKMGLKDYVFFSSDSTIASSLEEENLLGKTDFSSFERATQDKTFKKSVEQTLKSRIEQRLKDSEVKPAIIILLLKYVSLLSNDTTFIANCAVRVLKKVSENPAKREIARNKIKEYFSKNKEVLSKIAKGFIQEFSKENASKERNLIEPFLDGRDAIDKVTLASKCFFSKGDFPDADHLFMLCIKELKDLEKIEHWNLESLEKYFILFSKEGAFSEEEVSEAFFKLFPMNLFPTKDGFDFIERLNPYLTEKSRQVCVTKALEQLEGPLENALPYFQFVLKKEFSQMISLGQFQDKLLSYLIETLPQLNRILQSQGKVAEAQKTQISFILERMGEFQVSEEKNIEVAVALSKLHLKEPLMIGMFIKVLSSISNTQKFKDLQWNSTQVLGVLDHLKEDSQSQACILRCLKEDEFKDVNAVGNLLLKLDLPALAKSPAHYFLVLRFINKYLLFPEKDEGVLQKIGAFLGEGERLTLREEEEYEHRFAGFTYHCSLGNWKEAIDEIKKCPRSYLEESSKRLANCTYSWNYTFILALRGISPEEESPDAINALSHQFDYLREKEPTLVVDRFFCQFGENLLANLSKFPEAISKCSSSFIHFLWMFGVEEQWSEFSMGLMREIHTARLKEKGICVETFEDLRLYLNFIGGLQDFDGELEEFITEHKLFFDDEKFQKLIRFYDFTWDTSDGEKFPRKHIQLFLLFFPELFAKFPRKALMESKILSVNLGMYLGIYGLKEMSEVCEEFKNSREPFVFCKSFYSYLDLVFSQVGVLNPKFKDYVALTNEIFEKCVKECKNIDFKDKEHVELLKNFYQDLYRIYSEDVLSEKKVSEEDLPKFRTLIIFLTNKFLEHDPEFLNKLDYKNLCFPKNSKRKTLKESSVHSFLTSHQAFVDVLANSSNSDVKEFSQKQQQCIFNWKRELQGE